MEALQRVTLENETKVGLLYALKDFTEQATRDIILPVKRQSRDEEEPEPRAAAVYLARLPDMTSFEKKVPFILHQIVTGEDVTENLNRSTGYQTRMELKSSAVVRSVFCVYQPDEQEGALALLTLMEQMRIELLLRPILGKTFVLNLREGINQAIYPETGERGTAPYYLGEMVTVWKLPPVERLDAARIVRGWPAHDPQAVHLTDTIPESEDGT